MDLQALKDQLAMGAYGMTKSEAHAKGICIDCKTLIEHETQVDEAEYRISGLCAPCFNKTYEPGEET